MTRARLLLAGVVALCGCVDVGVGLVPPLVPLERVPTEHPAPFRPDGAPSLVSAPEGEPGPPSPCPLPFDRPDTAFADVTDCARIDAPHERDDTLFAADWTSGQAWGDLDGDGSLDLVVSGQLGGNRVLLNGGQGRFARVDPSGLEGIPAAGVTLLDVDGDGDRDVHLAAPGFDRLLLNDGTGRFAEPAGGTPFDHPGLGVAAAWADWDEDGDLDPYAVNYLCVDCEELGETDLERASDLFWQRGDDGTMTDRRALLGDPQLLAGAGFQATWFDADDDGDLDLLVVNDRGAPGDVRPDEWLRRNVYFRNDGPGCEGWCFQEAAVEFGLDARLDSMGVAVGDVDNDGDLDLYVTDTTRGVLLLNDGGKFLDATVSAGLGRPMEGWGCAFLDYDNDGWLDLYVAGGWGLDDALWRNDGDGTFTEVGAAAAGANGGLWSLGVAAADYDGDGRVDLLVADAGERYRLHRNLLETGHGWLGLRLVGSGIGGRDAVGATVRVTTDDGLVQRRDVRIGSSMGSGDDLGLHFGLGDAGLDSVVVRWPDGVEQGVDAVPNAWSVLAREAR